MISYTKPALNKSAIKRMKREAKRTAVQQGISYNQALDRIAQPLGYNNWSVLFKNAQNAAFSPIQLSATKYQRPGPKKWLTVTALSKRFATTIPKVRAALKHAGYIGENGLPNAIAYSLNIVQEHTIVDSYGISTGLTSYYKWDLDVVEALFPPASELDQWCHAANRFAAERRMCETFTRAGNALGLVFDDEDEDPINTTHPGLSSTVYQALLDAHHGTMYFLGDPYAFVTSRGKKGVKVVELHVRPLIANIAHQLRLVNPAEALFFEQACAKLFHWLGTQRR